MAYERRDYAGGAAETTIVGDITASSTTITIAASTGWPAGSNGPFLVVIDDGTASEEKVQVLSRSGTTLTINSTSERGFDGTSATSHTSGASIKHVHGAQDANEANYWVAELAAAVNTAGDIPVADANNSLTTLAKGSNSTVLQVSSGGTLQYGTVTSAMITDGTIATGDIADSQVTNAKLAGMTRGTLKVGNSSGVASDLALGTSGYYLKSDGTDAVWAAAADSWTTVTKGSDQSKTSTTSLAVDSALQFATTANKVYQVEAVIIVAAPAAAGLTPGLKFVLGIAEDTTQRGSAQFIIHPDTGGAGSTTAQAGTGYTTATADAYLLTTKQTIYINGTYIAGGGTAGFFWAQINSSVNATTVYANSVLRYRAIT